QAASTAQTPAAAGWTNSRAFWQGGVLARACRDRAADKTDVVAFLASSTRLTKDDSEVAGHLHQVAFRIDSFGRCGVHHRNGGQFFTAQRDHVPPLFLSDQMYGGPAK